MEKREKITTLNYRAALVVRSEECYKLPGTVVDYLNSVKSEDPKDDPDRVSPCYTDILQVVKTGHVKQFESLCHYYPSCVLPVFACVQNVKHSQEMIDIAINLLYQHIHTQPLDVQAMFYAICGFGFDGGITETSRIKLLYILAMYNRVKQVEVLLNDTIVSEDNLQEACKIAIKYGNIKVCNVLFQHGMHGFEIDTVYVIESKREDVLEYCFEHGMISNIRNLICDMYCCKNDKLFDTLLPVITKHVDSFDDLIGLLHGLFGIAYVSNGLNTRQILNGSKISIQLRDLTHNILSKNIDNNDEQLNPLFRSISEFGTPEIMNEFINKFTNIDLVTLLNWAVSELNIDMIKFLIEEKHVNLQLDDIIFQIILSRRRPSSELVNITTYLIEHGADGRRAIQDAIQKDYEDGNDCKLTTLLLDHSFFDNQALKIAIDLPENKQRIELKNKLIDLLLSHGAHFNPAWF
jgi:hypothetical protein